MLCGRALCVVLLLTGWSAATAKSNNPYENMKLELKNLVKSELGGQIESLRSSMVGLRQSQLKHYNDTLELISELRAENEALRVEVERYRELAGDSNHSSGSTGGAHATFRPMFHVYQSGNMEVGKKAHLRFNTVVTNIGDGYHSQTGTFVAPVAGHYFFVFSLLSASGKQAQFDVVKNGVSIGRATADTSEYQGATTSALIRLAADEPVWVEGTNSGPHFIASYRETSFSGFLVEAD